MKIVVRVMPNHPTGTRRRAGFVFTQDPIAVDVDNEQLEAIKADSYLKIITAGTAFEQGMASVSQEMTKKEIIEKLVEQGLVEGVDFNDRAKKEDLIKLIN